MSLYIDKQPNVITTRSDTTDRSINIINPFRYFHPGIVPVHVAGFPRSYIVSGV